MALSSKAPLLAPKALILVAPGSNREADLAHAIQTAGGDPHTIPLNMLSKNKDLLDRYRLVALPGGFSYGDLFGAGRAWAHELTSRFQDILDHFIDGQRAVIGVGNGFQALVRAGILPHARKSATLAQNASGQFESRWVQLSSNRTNPSPWLIGINLIECPVAHYEGRFVIRENSTIPEQQIAFYYVTRSGKIAAGDYPANPNGSTLDIAGLTNLSGNVLGMMPHPENHVIPWQHPAWTRDTHGGLCVRLFENGLKAFCP